MALYKADVWLGSNSGRQTVSVSASTPTGAKEQIRTIYHVSDTAIWNVREVPRQRPGGGESADDDGSLWGGAALVALIVVAWVSKARMVQVRTDMMHDHCIRLCTDPAGVAFAGPGRPEYNTSP